MSSSRLGQLRPEWRDLDGKQDGLASTSCRRFILAILYVQHALGVPGHRAVAGDRDHGLPVSAQA
jgi:hypothetical protein